MLSVKLATLLDTLKSARQNCYSVAMIVARQVIRYSANIYLAAKCVRPDRRVHMGLCNWQSIILIINVCYNCSFIKN